MTDARYTVYIDKAYSNYLTYIHDVVQGENQIYGDWYGKEEFINKCKMDNEFSEKWGLKIEERELSLVDRTKILVSKSDNKKDFYDRNGRLIVEEHTLVLDEANIPTKLITITYNDKTIENYE